MTPRAVRRPVVPSTDAFVEVALQLIDLGGGSHGVNLREVARRLGCAHTNAYNYFASLDALLGRALTAALDRQLQCTQTAMNRAGKAPRRRARALIQSQIHFALTHPGWYRFIWLEPLRAPPEPAALERMQRAGEVLGQLLHALTGGRHSDAHARLLAEDFHTYLHGALCKAIAGRFPPSTLAQAHRRLSSSAHRVLRELIDSPKRSSA